ncbi:MAG TPA: hypothetical protein VFV49_05890, partial [Thermoanaerobaculia bacterium]|nr:hypothetical protein [Thermoanaerobaculia bacterium]
MSNEVRFLVVRGGPLGDFFETLLSGAGTLVTFDGSQKTEDYDLLVLDGGSLSASAFEKGATAAKAALDANKPVLILTPTTDHKDVLAAAGALRAYPRGGSVALLIEPHRNADDKLSLWLAEQYAPDAGNGRLYRTVGGAGHDEDAAAATSDVFEVQAPSLPSTTGIAPFIERLRGAVSALKAGRLLASASKGPKDPPPDIPSDLYDVTPVNLFYEIKITEHTNPGWFPTGAVRLEGTAYIGVYYDNLHNTPLQWLLIEHSGLFYTGGMEDDDEGGRGWSLGALHIEGPNISSQALATHLSSPNNVNGVRTYSSGTSFTV